MMNNEGGKKHMNKENSSTIMDNPAFIHHTDDPTAYTIPVQTPTHSQSDGVIEKAALSNEEIDHNDDDDDESDDEEQQSIFSLLPGYENFQKQIEVISEHEDKIIALVLAAIYIGYFIAVLVISTDTENHNYWCDSDGFLMILTFFTLLGFAYYKVVKKYYGTAISKTVLKPCEAFLDKLFVRRWVPWLIFAVLVVFALLFVIIDARDDLQRLQSLLGIICLLTFGFIFSAFPRKIRWRHTAWGLSLQFTLGLLILRWPFGQSVFNCAAGKVTTFLNFTTEGSNFVFGELSSEFEIFAFTVLPVILFFSFCIQILYYLGIMQVIVLKLGWFLSVTLGTTACESVNAAANIFLGQTEAPLLVKPYIPLMTKSELHAVMTGGFATVSGSVLAAYISFGVDPVNLISASVMNAPAALAFSKLFYPETKRSKTSVKDLKMEKGDEANWLHAAMVGVTNAIPLVANIAANLVAFYAFIALCSHVFDWSCTLAGADEGVCTLQNLFGWFFMPLAWVMGVEWAYCDEVGELIGLKTIVNEFVAYARLSEMVENGELSKRAETIATYALCGFSNISSIGIVLGGFGAMAPNRRGDLARVVVRAMIAGSCATFLTACVAGCLLTVEEDEPTRFASSLYNLPRNY